MTNVWIKPNGVSVPVNENSAEHARKLGWLPEAESRSQAKAKAEAEKAAAEAAKKAAEK